MSNTQTAAHEDEIIFSAQYSILKAWFSLLVAFLPVFWLLCYAAYTDVMNEQYMKAVILIVIAAPVALFMLDTIFFARLVFYEDRVVKSWHAFGQRTIYYSTARLNRPPRHFRWVSSAYAIRQVKCDGSYLFMQVPILYIAFFFPTSSAKKIDLIVDYLTSDSTYEMGMFTKHSLSKEEICLK